MRVNIVLRILLVLAAVGLITGPTRAAIAPVPDEIPVALLVDLSTGQTLYERESDRRFVPASITKVMTAYTAFKLINNGELSLNTRFNYTLQLEEEWYGEGSNMFLRAGETPTIGQLLLGITTVSGNDASVALAQAATGSLETWLDLMNENARELGMRDTHFGSPNGYPDGGKTYTSARDLVKLGEAITQHYPGLYRRYFGHRQLTWRNITQQNHDPVTGVVRGADGLKTGFTSEAGFTFLGTAARDGRRLLMVLAAAPSMRMRDTTARELLEWGFDAFTPRQLFAAGAIVGNAQVQDGDRSSVPLRMSRDFEAALPEEAAGQMTMAIAYRGPVRAPISAGDVIARLQLLREGDVMLEVPLEAAQNVERASLWRRITNAFAAWF